MKLLKPSWVNHEGSPIFSIDIHPDGSRFATGGQGADCGRVCIWNMASIVNESDELNENVPKILCRLDNHLSCVNCVRWSTSGRYLASAGDDKIIMIWQFAGQGGVSFSGQVTAEQWRCASSLRGHSGDILDLNWSPQDRFLASCSVDTTIRIWNAENMPECLKVIQSHQGFVKGVAWDPMNKYLASQSDDKSIKIWRTSDWKEEKSITKPFNDCGGTTHVLRLSWCPDGQFLASAHAMNNLGSTSQIIDRDTWGTEKDFVGHRKAVTCTRFNPHMLFKEKKDSKKKKKSMFFAITIGSRDRSLSVWLTNLRRPLLVMHDLFNDSILDISWAQDGYRFLACSWDGTVAYFEFTKEELGEQLDKDEYSTYLHGLYGKSMLYDAKKTNDVEMFVEDVQFLSAREKRSPERLHLNGQSNSEASCNRILNENSSSRPMSHGPTDKQIEMRLSDGRRRITPLFIPPITNGDGMPTPFNAGEQTKFASSSNASSSKIQIEKTDSQSQLAKSMDPDRALSPQFPRLNNGVAEEKTVKQPSKPVVTKECEKQKKRKSDAGPPRPPSPKMIRDEPQTFVKLAERKQMNTEKSAKERNDTRLNLFPLRCEKNFAINLVKGNTSMKEPCLFVENGTLGKLSLIKLTDGMEIQWQVVISSKVAGASNSDKYLCVACEDYSLHVFNLFSGSRQMCPILLPALTSKLRCLNGFLLLITVKATLWMWDLNNKKILIRNTSLSPLINHSQEFLDLDIVRLTLSEDNAPIVQLSTGRTYIYNLELEVWQLISDSQDVLSHCCEYKPPRTSICEYPLAQFQNHMLTSNNVFNGNHRLQAQATLSYLDQQLTAALQIGSKKDYHFWVTALARHVTREGLEVRFRELCEFLLGSPMHIAEESEVNNLLGLNKHDLLKEVLKISTSNLKLQRVHLEFKEQLELTSSNGIMN